MMISRRKIMAACASFIGLHVLQRRAWAAEAQGRAAATYQVDLGELIKAFPSEAGSPALPTLLSRFGEWMAGKPWRSIGAFDLAVEWSDGHIRGGEFYYDQFALFIRLPDGSSVGYWLDGRDLAEAPIVLLGSEGDFVTLAADLEARLARIALGYFSRKGPAADFLYSDVDYGEGVVPDLRGAMQAFLREQTGTGDLDSLARKTLPNPTGFTEWVAKSVAAYEARMQAHPAILAMTSILGKYRPVNGQPWEGTPINVRWVDTDFEAWVMPRGETLAEAEQLRPYLAALRDEAAMTKAGLGLWHRATLMVYTDRLELLTDYLFEPDFRSEKPSANAFKADQARAPRAPRRVPPWLAAILAS
jgi:hypothetical protein